VPELPEVETIVRQIRPLVRGRVIRRVSFAWAGCLAQGSPRGFRRRVVGARIGAVRRRAKFFILDLERAGRPAGHVVGHLRMSGRLYVERAPEARDPHERLRLELAGGRSLVFCDVRKFGRIQLVSHDEIVFGALGPEPLEPAFTAVRLEQALKPRRRRLKGLLLDQRVVAGLGNIYVDEALHRARLHPLARCDRLSRAAIRRLHGAVRQVLRAAIRREGSSFDSFYRTPEGRPGRFQDQFRVYGRAGRPCRVCGSTIVRLVVGQRGTHVCPRCQRAPRRDRPVA
jgi:formamidopyrimidine-DNA glycosylase